MMLVFYVVLVVVVIVVVAVSVGVGDFVQDGSQDIGFAFFQEGFGLPGFFWADFSTGQDEDDSVYFAAHDGGVGDDQDGRHVEEDVVIVFIDFFQQVHHAGRSQEFCRVWRNGAAGHDVEIGKNVFLDDLMKGYVFGKAVG